MNVLIIGQGGREHAIAWKLSQSPGLSRLYIAKGNAGTASVGTNVEIDINDFGAIKKFILDSKIELLVVGPEEPLVKGIHDYFMTDIQLKNIPVIGPVAKAAQLEGSKDFAKKFMIKYGIPTARFETFSTENINAASVFLKTLTPPYVLKADGLAAGKGVLIYNSLDETMTEIKEMIQKLKFGSASRKVVIEEYLAGIECSVFVLTDGSSYKVLPPAKDYKRVGAGDTGLNTGGMGSVSPVPFADDVFMKRVEERIIKPTMVGLKSENLDYKGFIFFGLMNVGGYPYLIEYNVRMGDPEAEAVIPRIKSDLLDLFQGVAKGTLDAKSLEIDSRYCATVFLVSGGYPGEYKKGFVIEGLKELKDSLVFHAGTKFYDSEKTIVTDGGRVIAITSFGQTIPEAFEKSYQSAEKINFENKYCRADLGKDLI